MNGPPSPILTHVLPGSPRTAPVTDELGLHVMLSSLLQRNEQSVLKKVIQKYDPLCSRFFFNEQRKFAFITASSLSAKELLLDRLRRYSRDTLAERTLWRTITIAFETPEERGALLKAWQEQHVPLDAKNYSKDGSGVVVEKNAGWDMFEYNWPTVFRVTSIEGCGLKDHPNHQLNPSPLEEPVTFSFPLSTPWLRSLNEGLQSGRVQGDIPVAGLAEGAIFPTEEASETSLESLLGKYLLLGNHMRGRHCEVVLGQEGGDLGSQYLRVLPSVNERVFCLGEADLSWSRQPVEWDKKRFCCPSSGYNQKGSSNNVVSRDRTSCNILPKSENFGPKLGSGLRRTKLGFGSLVVRRGWEVTRCGEMSLFFPEETLNEHTLDPNKNTVFWRPYQIDSSKNPSLDLGFRDQEAVTQCLSGGVKERKLFLAEFRYPMQPWFIRERTGAEEQGFAAGAGKQAPPKMDLRSPQQLEESGLGILESSGGGGGGGDLNYPGYRQTSDEFRSIPGTGFVTPRNSQIPYQNNIYSSIAATPAMQSLAATPFATPSQSPMRRAAPFLCQNNNVGVSPFLCQNNNVVSSGGIPQWVSNSNPPTGGETLDLNALATLFGMLQSQAAGNGMQSGNGNLLGKNWNTPNVPQDETFQETLEEDEVAEACVFSRGRGRRNSV